MNIQPVTLAQAHVGDFLRIIRISDPETATIALRLGLAEGECVELASKIPGGPVVLRLGMMELALGRLLCNRIEVEAMSRQTEGTLLPCPS